MLLTWNLSSHSIWAFFGAQVSLRSPYGWRGQVMLKIKIPCSQTSICSSYYKHEISKRIEGQKNRTASIARKFWERSCQIKACADDTLLSDPDINTILSFVPGYTSSALDTCTFAPVISIWKEKECECFRPRISSFDKKKSECQKFLSKIGFSSSRRIGSQWETWCQHRFMNQGCSATIVVVSLTSSFIAEPPDPIREPVMPFGSRNLMATLLVMTSLEPKLVISVLLIVCGRVGSYYSYNLPCVRR